MGKNTNQLLKALEENLAKEYWSENQKIEKIEIGKIHLPTGEIVAVDPLGSCSEKDKFSQKVEPGQYPVYLYISDKNQEKKVAFAQIQITKNKATTYKIAQYTGDEESQIDEGELYGYSVDSGVGSFMDAKAAKKLDQNLIKIIDTKLEENYVDTYSTANIPLDEKDLNIIAFSGGYGDGVYSSYYGIDQNGNICSITTDFQIIK